MQIESFNKILSVPMTIVVNVNLVCCRGAGGPRQQGELPGGDRGRDGRVHRVMGLLPPGVELETMGQ